MPSETSIQNAIRLAVSKTGRAIALRNNTGMFKTFDGRTIQAGLGTGTSDLIGIVEHTIRPCDVGKTLGIFLAMEVKTDIGRVRDGQSAFLSQVAKRGGVGGIVRSVADAESLLFEKWDSPAAWKTTEREPE